MNPNQLHDQSYMENYNDDKTKGLDKTKLIKNVKATYAKDENE